MPTDKKTAPQAKIRFFFCCIDATSRIPFNKANVCGKRTIQSFSENVHEKRKDLSMRSNRKPQSRKPPHIPMVPREILEIVERGQILVSGVTGIDEYQPSLVRIRTAKGILAITGDALTLCWAGEKRLQLKGNLETVSFLLR